MLIEISLCVCVCVCEFFVIIISLLTKSKPFNKRALTLIVPGFWEGHSSTCTTRIADKLANYGQFYETICCRILHQPNQPLSSHQFQLVSLLVLLGEKGITWNWYVEQTHRVWKEVFLGKVKSFIDM